MKCIPWDFNFDNYLGDSRDDLEYSYRGLDQMKEEYFKKYKTQFPICAYDT